MGMAETVDNNDTFVTGEELYRRYINGDEAAFEELVELYERDLTMFLYGITKDYHEAKHLMIDTFAQLVISKGQFAGKSLLKTYIFTIGKNLALRAIKLRRHNQHIDYDMLAETVSSNENLEVLVEQNENKEYLHKTMKTLKEEYRIVLELLYFNDMSYSEAGMVMGKNEKQITNLAYRAKLSLKKKLEGSGFKLNL